MSTTDGVMWFAKSQLSKMHFKNQRAIIVQGKVMSSKSRRLRSVEELTHHAERGKAAHLTPTAGYSQR
jgi:hypothetical protein